MKRPAAREVAFIVGALPGVAMIFPPFIYEYVPLGVLVNAYEREFGGWRFMVHTSLPLLAVAILASTVRQALFGPLTRLETRAAHLLAFAALAATTFLMLAWIIEGPGRGEGSVAFPSVLLLAVGSAIVLAATRRGSVPPGTHAHIAMLVAWMPNFACCLAVLGPAGGWEAGFYLAIVALAAYAVEATLRVRAARRREG